MRFSNIQLLPALFVITSYSAAGVHAFAQAQRHRLGGGGDVHAGQQLVDDLHLAAGAGAVAQPVDLGGHRVEQRRRPWRRPPGVPAVIIVIWPAAALAAPPEIGASRYSRPALGQPRLERDRPVRVDGRAHHEHGCRAASPRPRRRSPNSTASVCAALTTTQTTTSQAARQFGRAWRRPRRPRPRRPAPPRRARRTRARGSRRGAATRPCRGPWRPGR